VDIVIAVMKGDTIGRDRGLVVPVGPLRGDRPGIATLEKAMKIPVIQTKAGVKIAGLKTVAKVGEKAATIAVVLGKSPRKVPIQTTQSLALATRGKILAIVIQLQSLTPGIVPQAITLQDMPRQGMTILSPQRIVTLATMRAIGLPQPMTHPKPIAPPPDDRGGGPPLVVRQKKGLPMSITVPSSLMSRT
jgi:hypothetical protein